MCNFTRRTRAPLSEPIPAGSFRFRVFWPPVNIWAANFNLLSASPGLPPNGAYFDLFVENPGNTADKLEIIAFSATSLGVVTLNGSTQVHTLSGAPPPFSFGTTLSTVDGISYEGTSLGNWTVSQSGCR